MKPAFSAVLLAGGQSRRMGRDKAFLEIDGRPLWQRQLRLLRALAPQEVFLAGPERAEWNGEECEIIADAQPGAGPLGGLVAALRRASTPLLLALAIDLPNMTSDYLRGLLAGCTAIRGMIPRTSNHFEPLAAIFPIAALPIAVRCLESENYSLQRFAEICLNEQFVRQQIVAPEEARFFLNLNTPEDLVAIAHNR